MFLVVYDICASRSHQIKNGIRNVHASREAYNAREVLTKIAKRKKICHRLASHARSTAHIKR